MQGKSVSRRSLAAAGLAGAATVAAGWSQASAAPGWPRPSEPPRSPGRGPRDEAASLSGLGWVSIRDYEDQVPNPGDPEEDWDWTTAIQAAIDESQGRVIYFPNTLPRYLISDYITLRENTRLHGDGNSTLYFAFELTGETAIERSGFFRLREEKVINNPTTEFSRNIRVSGLTFEARDRAGQSAYCTFRLVNVRDVRIEGCTFINCGGVFVTAELQMNGAYDRGNPGASGDPAVEAGFSPTDTNDLSEDIVFVDNVIDGRQYFVMGIRLNFVKRAIITGNICRYASISWWGGGARKGEGGEKTHLRRCIQFTIANNYVSWNNGSIYGNNGTEISITGNVCEYSIDTAIDMEGCTNYVVDSNTVRYAGNFCYSAFYSSHNGVFSNNVAIQGSKAAGLGDVGQQLGREVFRHIASFDDEGRPEQFAIRGNTFSWEDDSGFGLLRLNNWCDVVISDNHFSNVLVHTSAGNNKYSQVFANNELRFTNPTQENDVYVALGRQIAGRLCAVRGNTIRVANADQGAVPLLVLQVRYPGDTVSIVDGNTVEADCTISIAYADIRGNPSAARKHYVRFHDNTVLGTIKNLSTSTTESVAVRERDNMSFILEDVAVDTEPDVSRFAQLRIGMAVE